MDVNERGRRLPHAVMLRRVTSVGRHSKICAATSPTVAERLRPMSPQPAAEGEDRGERHEEADRERPRHDVGQVLVIAAADDVDLI
jgi:hypothetical protein